MASRSKDLTAAEAWVDHQLSPYWEKALLGLIAAERIRETAAGDYDARGAWDVDGFPWSVVILAALWDERRPLRPRAIADWAAAVGRKPGMPTLRSTLAQMAQTCVLGGAGSTVIAKDGMVYRLGDDLSTYFVKRWARFRPAEMRWGLRERAVEDRGGGDFKTATDQQLANMTRTVAAKEARVEIERRLRAGAWSGAVYVEGAAAAASGVSAASGDEVMKYPNMRMAHEGVPAAAAAPVGAPVAGPKPSGPAPYVEPENVRREREAMEAKFVEDDRRVAELTAMPKKKIIELHDAGPQIDATGEAIDWNGWDMILMQISERGLYGSIKGYEEVLAMIRSVKARVGEDILDSDWPDSKPPTVASVAKLAVVEPAVVSPPEHPDIPYPNTHNEPLDRTVFNPEFPDDVEAIYPTEDELAAILRGEVVGPAAPPGFEESLDSGGGSDGPGDGPDDGVDSEDTEG